MISDQMPFIYCTYWCNIIKSTLLSQNAKYFSLNVHIVFNNNIFILTHRIFAQQ